MQWSVKSVKASKEWPIRVGLQIFDIYMKQTKEKGELYLRFVGRAIELLKNVPIVVLGPIAEESIDGINSEIWFADCFYGYIRVYFKRSKWECLESSQEYLS